MAVILSYTLVADGPADRALLPIVNWALSAQLVDETASFVEQIADFRWLPRPPQSLADRLREAIRLYPCDLLFVHRDAEARAPAERIVEIERSAAGVEAKALVPIVPVRMTEAWLLVDEQAIRFAADNPNGRVPLEVPAPRHLERLADPKRALKRALIVASGKTGRRRAQFERDLASRISRVAAGIDDFGVLRQLSAFREFEDHLARALQAVA